MTRHRLPVSAPDKIDPDKIDPTSVHRLPVDRRLDGMTWLRRDGAPTGLTRAQLGAMQPEASVWLSLFPAELASARQQSIRYA
jgi:hypothetical protein